MIEKEHQTIEVRNQARMPRIMKEVFSKILGEKIFIVERPKTLFNPACLESGLHKFMKRLLVFDLPYLKELKRETFRSDYDELQFAISILFDVTRAIAERDPSLQSLTNDSLKMTRAFSYLKNRIGIMVPFGRCIDAFRQLSDECLKRKMKIDTADELFVGTPDMFRGVEKDIIIVAQLRNSMVDGLGLLDREDFVRLAFSRAKQFLWVIGSSPTFRPSGTAGANLWSSFFSACQQISVGSN